MNDDLIDFLETFDELLPANGVIGVYWDSARQGWRVQMDDEKFLQQFAYWDENKHPGSRYPYELVADYGTVEVFCLVEKVPK